MREIECIIEKFRQLPYLFVGTGVSMRYGDAPSWNELLYELWKTTNGNKDKLEFKKFEKGIVRELKVDKARYTSEEIQYRVNPTIATRIQNQFNDKFFNDEVFCENLFSQKEMEEIINDDYDPFKFYITKMIAGVKEKECKEIEELKWLKENENKIAGIITTNYDNLLDNIFTDFDKLIGQKQMLTSNMESLFQIFKIHGSIENPNSIIITEEDYSEFEKKLKYLSAKLLTLFIEHPIIFIGYSISDINIRNILKEIAICLDKTQLDELKDKFIFVTLPEDNIEGEYKITMKDIEFECGNIKMLQIELNDFSVLFKAFNNLKSSLPLKVMRKMQNMICNFIETTEPTNNVFVSSIDNSNIEESELGFYISKIDEVSDIGFRSYKLEDILEDIIYDNKKYLKNIKLVDTFKNIRSVAGKTYLPIYKYLDCLSLENIPKNWLVIRSLGEISITSMDYKRTKENIEFTKIEDIENQFTKAEVILSYIFRYACEGKIETEELGEFLKANFHNPIFRVNICLPTLKKLVAIYDYKKYKNKEDVIN